MESQTIVIVIFVLLAFHWRITDACCPTLTLPTGLYFTDAPVTYASAETIAVACSLSYVATGGSGNGKCVKSGSLCSWTWSATNNLMLQCTRGCLAPSLTQGVEYVSGTSNTSYLSGTAVSLKCSTNYGVRVGSTTGTCNGTTFTWKWAAGKLECDPVCPAPTLSIGTEFSSGNSSEYTLNDAITLRCSSGYASTGGSTSAVCLSDNTWQWDGAGILQCSPVCPLPTLPSGVQLVSSTVATYTLGNTISVQCISNYGYFSGNYEATCGNNNVWDWSSLGELQCHPTCLPPAAGVSATVSASFSKNMYLLNDIIQFECASGYVPLSGSSTGVCSSINQWTWQAGATASLSCVIAPPYKDRISDTFKPSTCQSYVLRSAPTSSTCLINCLNDGYCRGHSFDGSACYLDRPFIEADVGSSMPCLARQYS